MRILIAPPHHYSWICERAHVTPGPEFRALEAVDEHWGIQAMVGLDAWTKTAVALHVACRNPLVMRQLARETFRRVFLDCDKRIAMATVRGTNERSQRLVRGLGFREVFRGKDYFDIGDDMVGFEMRREECRWIPSALPRLKEVA